jgi:hypothetical protein
VQDLERQLMESQQQVERLRAKESRTDPHNDFNVDGNLELGDSPTIGRSPRRMLKARTPQDLTLARAHLSDVGRGLLKPPVTGAQSSQNKPSPRDLDLPPLPSRTDADQLLSYYFECIHRQFPVLHWQTFHRQYIEFFEGPPNATKSPEWVAVLLVVLACGLLSTRDPNRMAEAQDYLTKAVSIINFWEDDVGLNQAIVAFLASIFLAEVNRKTASWIWLGSALRIGQDIGLHVQGGQWSTIDGEMRKRIWYSFYVWDRYAIHAQNDRPLTFLGCSQSNWANP